MPSGYSLRLERPKHGCLKSQGRAALLFHALFRALLHALPSSHSQAGTAAVSALPRVTSDSPSRGASVGDSSHAAAVPEAKVPRIRNTTAPCTTVIVRIDLCPPAALKCVHASKARWYEVGGAQVGCGPPPPPLIPVRGLNRQCSSRAVAANPGKDPSVGSGTQTPVTDSHSIQVTHWHGVRTPHCRLPHSVFWLPARPARLPPPAIWPKKKNGFSVFLGTALCLHPSIPCFFPSLCAAPPSAHPVILPSQSAHGHRHGPSPPCGVCAPLARPGRASSQKLPLLPPRQRRAARQVRLQGAAC